MNHRCQFDEEDVRHTLLDDVMTTLTTDMPSASKTSSRDLAGILKNLRKVEQAVQGRRTGTGLRPGYTRRTKDAIFGWFVRACVFVYRGSVTTQKRNFVQTVRDCMLR